MALVGPLVLLCSLFMLAAAQYGAPAETDIYPAIAKSGSEEICLSTAEDPDADCIVGSGGVDYPVLTEVPVRSAFDCAAQSFPGLYADPEYDCQVFHICDAIDRRKSSFLCPRGTILDQRYFVCNWWFNVDCSAATSFYPANQFFYDPRIPPPTQPENILPPANGQQRPSHAFKGTARTHIPATANLNPQVKSSQQPLAQPPQPLAYQQWLQQQASAHQQQPLAHKQTAQYVQTTSYQQSSAQIQPPAPTQPFHPPPAQAPQQPQALSAAAGYN